MPAKIKRNELLQKLQEKRGEIFSLTFIKKDGSLREMQCRLGVKKGLKGTGLKYDPIAKGLLPVYDMALAKSGVEASKAYRMINLNTVKTLKLSKNSYLVID